MNDGIEYDLELFETDDDFDAEFEPRDIHSLEDLKWFISVENDADCLDRACVHCPHYKECNMKEQALGMIYYMIVYA